MQFTMRRRKELPGQLGAVDRNGFVAHLQSSCCDRKSCGRVDRFDLGAPADWTKQHFIPNDVAILVCYLPDWTKTKAAK